jgi:hypothetical protein
MTTLKSFASWLDTALCEAAMPVERRIAVLPISMTRPLKVRPGTASMLISAILIEFHVDDVGLVHLHFSSDERHVRDGHDGACRGVLNTGNHGFTYAYGQIGDDSLERSHRVVFSEHVGNTDQRGADLSDAALGSLELGASLDALCAGLAPDRASDSRTAAAAESNSALR